MKISDKLYICCIIFTMITIAALSILLIYSSVILFFKDNSTSLDIGKGCLGIFFATKMSWDTIGGGIRILKRMKEKFNDRRIY